ncbi:MAG TPA: 3-dehydroquinate synthase, partial [Polyangia bacterium]|nr:3-dehydroquinate synthase [Polyangia bacterium]
ALLAAGPSGRPAVLDGLDDFREHLGGQLTITLLRDVGAPVDVHEIRADLVQRALDWMRAAVAAAP